MRRTLGAILALLGAFLIILAILAQFWMPDRIKKAPLDTTETTRAAGTIQLSDGDGGLEESPVKGWSVTHADTDLSDGEVISYRESSCLVKDIGDPTGCVEADDPQERLISASTEAFATDRRTAEAVNDPDYVPADAWEYRGLVNKFPFDAEKKTYKYWDGLIGETADDPDLGAVDAVFDRTEEKDGTELYVYKISFTDAAIQITDEVAGRYDDEKEVWVEPKTGSIVFQSDHQERRDAETGDTVLILDLEVTDEEFDEKLDEAKSSADKLNLVTKTIPLVGWILGIPLLLIGLALLWFGGSSSGARAAE
ncbi:DUF3068 domain-containing protein [Nocardioides speluncae]|uniref:DUF3068 domain-containing protein n=1 Tax=Nocardioides speluncae TaxID=2670337 RepID=UPI00137ADED1|nr:DUF3068 domain-containing protein [Nocardioides speluncae]